MSFADWDLKEVAEVHKGLLLLGWRADGRLTSDDALRIRQVTLEALELEAAGKLDSNEIDRLSATAYSIICFEIMNIEERASSLSSIYVASQYFSSLMPLIDEATICWYRGYYTASLALLFIVLERYLRQLAAKKGNHDPKFSYLKQCLDIFETSETRDEATAVLNVAYAQYYANSPRQFNFNRHSLLHGVRGEQLDTDEMNCARMFLLFDLLCAAEDVEPINPINDAFQTRCRVFSGCSKLGSEQSLLRN